MAGSRTRSGFWTFMDENDYKHTHTHKRKMKKKKLTKLVNVTFHMSNIVYDTSINECM